MKNAEIKAIIEEILTTTDDKGNEIKINMTQRGNGYGIMAVRRVVDGGLGLPSCSPICYGVRVYGIEGEKKIREKLDQYAERIRSQHGRKL